MLKAIELLKELGATSGESAKSPTVKIQMLVDYIAEHNDGTENDEQSYEQVIFAAKKNIAQTIINSREGLNKADNEGVRDDVNVSMFLIAPETVIKNMTEQKLAEISAAAGQQVKNSNLIDDARENQAILEKQQKYTRALNLLRGKDLTYLSFEDVHSGVMNDMINLSGYLQEFESDQPIVDAFKTANKKGFLERIFRRTSREYNNFKRTFEQRTQGNASREELDDAAKAYLRRKLPGYNGRGLPNLEEIGRLSRRERNRALLCYKTLLASKTSREYEGKLGELLNGANRNIAAAGMTETFERMRIENSVIMPIENQIENNQPDVNKGQAKFQQNLANDIKEASPQINTDELNKSDNDLSLSSDDEPSIIDA